MVTEVTEDIFETPWDVLVHQANCFHTMNGGIAQQIRVRYPSAYKADLATKFGDREKFGSFSYALVGDPEKMIINMYSQFRYGNGKDTSYDKMDKALCTIVTELEQVDGQLTVVVPHGIGCGLGGGSWPVVRGLFETYFGNHQKLQLKICKLPTKN